MQSLEKYCGTLSRKEGMKCKRKAAGINLSIGLANQLTATTLLCLKFSLENQIA